MAAHKIPVEIRFWQKVKKTDTCWLWTAHTDKDGYGDLKINKRLVRAHRVSYEMHYEPIPEGLCVLHRCDNPPCVNPEHLFLGTNMDNVRDMMGKGRIPKGAQHSRAILPKERFAFGSRVNTAQLTDEKVIEILEALKRGAGLTDLGRQYGVCKQAIYRIREGQTWKHIPRL